MLFSVHLRQIPGPPWVGNVMEEECLTESVLTKSINESGMSESVLTIRRSSTYAKVSQRVLDTNRPNTSP